jgi:hypothetical protein
LLPLTVVNNPYDNNAEVKKHIFGQGYIFGQGFVCLLTLVNNPCDNNDEVTKHMFGQGYIFGQGFVWTPQWREFAALLRLVSRRAVTRQPLTLATPSHAMSTRLKSTCWLPS